ncbi:SDR family oxidoreductase [Micropruina sonneratiae]|uniref:SDR family oxidoreductase n=1 Tax=Micropruina sonneratiae TaxID=2986940 RepID=UPI0022276802|nr:SDR family oxidoreductase [Micropruina sp. KQZ13P-5]MCW3158513.1 SDR family oxidoreductase [Micropruina sp. KQZ13P-5]
MTPNGRPIALTGVTGNLGGRIADRLAATDVPLRVLARDPARVSPRLGLVDVRRAAFGDTQAVTAALDGVDTVLMVSAAESADRLEQHRSFVDAAAAAGVRHLVYVSFFGAAPDATFTLARDHYVTEQYLRAAGFAVTFLRDNLYADFLTGLVGEDGVIRGPAGEGRVAAVAQDDIADAATTVLLDPAAHAGATYALTGPAALTLSEIADTIGRVQGRRVRYHDETLAEAYGSRAGYGAPPWQLDAWVSTYTAIAAGELAGVSDDVERLTGHPATTLEEVLARAAAAGRGGR